MVASVHNLSVAAQYCSRLVLLEKGRIASDGRPEQVLRSEILDGVYGIRTMVSPSLATGSLTVNGAVRQDASLADMIWNVAEIISECSRLWRLAPGDLIYTGTPEGVGPLISGDQVEVSIEDVGALNITIA